MKKGTASSGVALTEPNRFWCTITSGTCMKNTSATATPVRSTTKIGNPIRSRTTGTTKRANVIPTPCRRLALSDDGGEAPASDQQDQCKSQRHGAMRDPHRDPRHVTGPADPEHLCGIEIRLRKDKAGKHNEENLLGDPQQ